jgi:hypothetical protein
MNSHGLYFFNRCCENVLIFDAPRTSCSRRGSFTTLKSSYRSSIYREEEQQAIGTFDNVRTVSIVFVTFFALVAFGFIETVDCFVTELLTAKASIDSSKWLVRNGWISDAIDR